MCPESIRAQKCSQWQLQCLAREHYVTYDLFTKAEEHVPWQMIKVWALWGLNFSYLDIILWRIFHVSQQSWVQMRLLLVSIYSLVMFSVYTERQLLCSFSKQAICKPVIHQAARECIMKAHLLVLNICNSSSWF